MKRNAIVIAVLFGACVPPSTYVADVYYTDSGQLALLRCDFDGRGRATHTCFVDDGGPPPTPPTQAELAASAKAVAAAGAEPARPAPTADQVVHALASPGVHAAVELCRADYARDLASFAFTLTVEPTGDIRVAPHAVTGAFADCATRALRTANLGPYDGAPVSYEQQLTL